MKANEPPFLLVIESDTHVRNILAAELENNFTTQFFTSLTDAEKAQKNKSLVENPVAAVVELNFSNKNELAQYCDFFDKLPDVPIFLTLDYNSDYQLNESSIKSITKNILFRPFDVDKFISFLLAQNLKH